MDESLKLREELRKRNVRYMPVDKANWRQTRWSDKIGRSYVFNEYRYGHTSLIIEPIADATVADCLGYLEE